MGNSVLHTDGLTAYQQVGAEFIAHESVDHSANEYVRYVKETDTTAARVITSNQAENYFSQLKRSLDGTHHHVSPTHLQRYLDEFDFRYSTRKLSDSARMRMLVGQVEGRRLTLRPLLNGQ